ncbi:MAG: hypothetical protein K6F04_01430 [bacterium]|nr:hypothetical protein [bacterium]
MKHKVSILTLSLLCFASIFANGDANAQRGRKRSRHMSVAKYKKTLEASNASASTGATGNINADTISDASGCGAGTYFNGSNGCNLCPIGTWSTAGSTECVSCGDNIATCDATTGNPITCNAGYKIDGTKCVVDENAGTDPEEVARFKELKQKYALQLAEVSAECSGIASELERIKNLNAASTISSGAGTLAAGAAVGTSIVKASKDNKAIANAGKDFTEPYNTWIEKVKANKEKINTELTTEELNAVVSETKELAKEVNKKYKGLNDKKEDKNIKSLTEKLSAYNDRSAEKSQLETELNQEGTTEERKAEINKVIAEIDKEKSAYDEAVAKKAELEKADNEKTTASKDVVVKALNEMATMNLEEYTAQQSANTDTKTLGNVTTGLMAGATVASGVSATTSYIASAKSGSILDRVNECNNRLNDLKYISDALNSVELEEAQKIHEQAQAVVNACSFNRNAVENVKNLTLASGIISTVGTATAGAGTVTSALSNSDKKSNDAKKGLNTATIILAGVTTGTSGASTVTGGIAWSKINPVIESAKKCENVLRNNLVDVNFKTETILDSIPYAGENE